MTMQADRVPFWATVHSTVTEPSSGLGVKLRPTTGVPPANTATGGDAHALSANSPAVITSSAALLILNHPSARKRPCF